MGFLDKIREVAEEMERLAATESRPSRADEPGLLRRDGAHRIGPAGRGAASLAGNQRCHRPPLPSLSTGGQGASAGWYRASRRPPAPPTRPAPPTPAPPRGHRPATGFSLTPSDLPRAMILKEILGPPPGLSDEPW